MSDVIRTWPANQPVREIRAMFRPRPEDLGFTRYYFTLGKGKPKQQIERVWFTWRGRILGYFNVEEVLRNDGSFPQLRSISDTSAEWMVPRDYYVMICDTDCQPLRERLFMSGFRGWRYFDLERYRQDPESRCRL